MKNTAAATFTTDSDAGKPLQSSVNNHTEGIPMSEQHWNDVRAIHREWKGFYEIAGGSTVVMILLIFGGFMFTANILDDYTTNVFTEGLGVLATVLIVDLLNRRRAEQELKEQLLFELGSEDNSTALRALRLLKYKGWISNLEQIDLRKANLTGADLSNSSLIGANLSAINIADGNLRNTQLQRINLYFANLRDANLSGANLQAGELGRAILCGADLSDANMSGANLRYAGFDERTALPDSRIADVDTFNHRIIYDKYWTPDTDMTRYTDPNHPEFWQPEWVLNRGGDEAES